MQISLPSVQPNRAHKPCAVCGATRDDLEYVYPNGMRGMDIDEDLCMECAIHLWRAMKELYRLEYRLLAWELLRKYSVTKAAMADTDSKQ